MRASLSMQRACTGICNECNVTSCYFHEHCTCARANIIADIERELCIDDLSRLSVTIYIHPKDFLVFKTCFSIHLDHEEFKKESLFASSVHSYL